MSEVQHNEIPYIHYLRVLACWLVVALHATHVEMIDVVDNTFHQWLLAITRPCNSLFFMISGVLLLPYKSQDFLQFYKKRLSRIIIPLFFWGCIYSFLPMYLFDDSIKSAMYNTLWLPLTYPEQVGGILWYLYIYIGIIIFIPFISPSLYSDRRMLNLFIAVWFFCSVMYLVKDYHPYILGSNKWLHSFDMFVSFSGYLGYLLLAYRLHLSAQYPSMKKTFMNGVFSLFMIVSIFLLQFHYNRLPVGGYIYLLPTSILLSLFVFEGFRNFPFTHKSFGYSFIKRLSSLSFGIYLSHMMIFKTIVQTLIYQNSTAWHHQLLAITLTFVLSALFCYGISFLPVKKIIGL